MTDPAIPPTPDYEQLERLIEGDLDPTQAQALRAHIDAHPEWRDALDQVTTNRDLLRRLRHSRPTPTSPRFRGTSNSSASMRLSPIPFSPGHR